MTDTTFIYNLYNVFLYIYTFIYTQKYTYIHKFIYLLDCFFKKIILNFTEQ